MRLDEGIRMHGYEQIGIQLACFYQTHRQGNKVIAFPCQRRTHVGLFIYFGFEFSGNRQCDIFLMCSAAADCAWILAAMARIDGDGDQPYHFRFVFPGAFRAAGRLGVAATPRGLSAFTSSCSIPAAFSFSNAISGSGGTAG